MELLTPDAYKKYYAEKDLKEIIEELKKVETRLAEMDAEDAFGTKPSMVVQNAQDVSYLTQLGITEDSSETVNIEDKVQVTSSGEKSQKSLYMSYQRILTSLIKEKNEYF